MNNQSTLTDSQDKNQKVETSNLFTPKKLAKAYKFGINTVYRLTNIKGFPVITIGRKKFIPKNLFEEWIKNNLGKCI